MEGGDTMIATQRALSWKVDLLAKCPNTEGTTCPETTQGGYWRTPQWPNPRFSPYTPIWLVFPCRGMLPVLPGKTQHIAFCEEGSSAVWACIMGEGSRGNSATPLLPLTATPVFDGYRKICLNIKCCERVVDGPSPSAKPLLSL